VGDLGTPASEKQPVTESGSSFSIADLRQARLSNELAQAEYYRRQMHGTGKSPLPPWFVPALSAGFSLVGIVASILLSSAVAAHNVEREQQRTYARQKTQVRLSAKELRSALSKIDSADPYPPAFLNEEFIYFQPKRPASFSPDEPYYQKYDFVSTVYRVCALLGWLELYRRDPSFLSGPPNEKKKIEDCFLQIRKAFGDEFSSEKKKNGLAGKWIDGLILEDDQRAIGETMLEKDAPGVVIGYAAFCGRKAGHPHRNDEVGQYDGSQDYWVWNATRFIIELSLSEPSRDFKRQRVKKLIKALDDLIPTLGSD
jgi:hypothetical protein